MCVYEMCIDVHATHKRIPPHITHRHPHSLQDGETLLDYSHFDEVSAVLRKHGGKHSLMGAAIYGKLEAVEELIKEGADVNQQDEASRVGPQVDSLHMCSLRIDVRM